MLAILSAAVCDDVLADDMNVAVSANQQLQQQDDEMSLAMEDELTTCKSDESSVQCLAADLLSTWQSLKVFISSICILCLCSLECYSSWAAPMKPLAIAGMLRIVYVPLHVCKYNIIVLNVLRQMSSLWNFWYYQAPCDACVNCIKFGCLGMWTYWRFSYVSAQTPTG